MSENLFVVEDLVALVDLVGQHSLLGQVGGTPLKLSGCERLTYGDPYQKNFGYVLANCVVPTTESGLVVFVGGYLVLVVESLDDALPASSDAYIEVWPVEHSGVYILFSCYGYVCMCVMDVCGYVSAG
jgi:hypothetical protein